MTIRVYFATNRCPDDPDDPTGFLDHACGEDPQNLRFGVAEVDIKRRKVDFTVAPESHVGDPDRQVLGSEQVFDQLRRDMCEDPADCLFFIHGFANTFELALLRAAEIREFYARGAGPLSKKLHLFAFCWPSDGVLLSLPNAYRSDRIDAALSGVAIGRTILKALDFIANLPADERCNRRTCEVECLPGCGGCGVGETCNQAECACQCSEDATCAPGFVWNTDTCSCGCDTSINCGPTRELNPDTCSCDCGDANDDGRVDCNNACTGATPLCQTSLCTCRGIGG